MKKKKPFFARFLDNQITEQQKARVKGGDDWPFGPTTDKYPSDNEDGGDISFPRNDIDLHDLTTRKYPSDWEEC
jgi:hypothetical protein